MAADRVGGKEDLFIGVDVGTGSVRASLFTDSGTLVGDVAKSEIKTWSENGCLEQSSEDIWSAVCTTVKEVCRGREPSCVKGVGFDATCSLVAVGGEGEPVTVSLSHRSERNVILWQDHRALAEAEHINSTKHPVLKFVGGRMSPEMQPPKLCWLKRHLLDECWRKAAHFFDLADYLTFRATGSLTRSLCCVVCKWGYIGHQPEPGSDLCQGWNDSFFQAIGLQELVDSGYHVIGSEVATPGQPVGRGLARGVASELGLLPGTSVATAIIDAHAGGLGMLGVALSGPLSDCPLSSRLALIAGTSACHMVTCERPVFVEGVWGPYWSAMLPGTFLSEGGQSLAGKLLDHVLSSHSQLFQQLQLSATARGVSVCSELEWLLEAEASKRGVADPSLLTQHCHVLPDYHGNRSPLADPTIRGMVCGAPLAVSLGDLAVLYLATAQALAYGSRHIIEVLRASGCELRVILLCGGLRQNRLYCQLHADITGLPVVLPEEGEAMLVGGAILAASAAGQGEVATVMSRMSRVAQGPDAVLHPHTAVQEYHEKKYRIFLELYEDQKKYKRMMS